MSRYTRLMQATALAAMVALTHGGCKPADQGVRIKVEVKTNQGEPVSGADVLLDGKPLGITDLAGRLVSEHALPLGSTPRIEVKKDSDLYYFAPYFETFTVNEGVPAGDGTAFVEQEFKAMLYFVPKPKPGESTADVPVQVSEPPKDETAQRVETAEAPAVPEAVDTQVADAQVEVAPAEASDDVAPAPEQVEASEPVKAEPIGDAAPPEAIVGPEEAAASLDGTAALEPAPATFVVEPSKIQVTTNPAESTSLETAPVLAGKAPTLLTMQVTGNDQPLAEAEVSVGEEGAAGLRVGCTTNARGRCVIRFIDAPLGNVTVVVAKKGFKTGTLLAPLPKTQGLWKINLDHGQTLDIFAVVKSYNHTAGLKDVEIIVDGKHVGETDRFGRYSYVYEGKAEALMTIGLKPRGFLPETYETDFVAAGPMKLVKYFTPKEPSPVRMTVVEIRSAGVVEADGASAQSKALDEAVRSAARKYVFASSTFKDYPLALYERAAARGGKTLSQLLKEGWVDTELKAAVDALLVPTLIPGPQPALELSVVDSQARVLAAAREDLDSSQDLASVERALAVLAKKIAKTFPFEGAILTKEADKVTLNVGYSHGRGIKAGDVLDVYGVQLEKLGMSQLYKRIATLTVREVFDAESKAQVSQVAPRATIERGDLVVLRPRKVGETGGTEIRVTEAGSSSSPAIAQANVYFNDQWVGATDDSGRVFLDATGSGSVKVVKQGFGEYAKPASLAKGTQVAVSLKREAAFLRIDSKPSNLNVKVDGKVVGKTPLATGVAVPSGFVRLELEAPSGFKSYSAVLELEQGTLDLSGARSVSLETDLKAQADRLLKQGKTDEALAILEGIPQEHSDYLFARHEAGEIYLSVKNEPAKAAEAFGLVTANEAVKQFMDKRFIGSHINEGIALYLTAEQLAPTQPETARAHYQKAIEVLETVVPYLRFVPSDQYAQSVHNVDYHRGLARHRLWQLSQDPSVLADTVRTWRTYLDGSARSVPTDAASKAYVDNAQVYFKQAQASLNNVRNVSRQ